MNLLLTILPLFILYVNAVLSDREKYNFEMRNKLIASNQFNITDIAVPNCGFHLEWYHDNCWSGRTNRRFLNCCENFISNKLVEIIRGLMYIYEMKFHSFLFDTEDEFKNYSVSLVKTIFKEEDIFNSKFYPWYYPAEINVKFEDIISFQNIFIHYDLSKENEARYAILKLIYSKRLENNMINEYDAQYFSLYMDDYLRHDPKLKKSIIEAIENLHEKKKI